jgi:flagellar basal body-associated protein FliL
MKAFSAPSLARRALAALLAVLVLAVFLAAPGPSGASSPPPEAKEGGGGKEEGKDKGGLPKNFLEFEPLTVNLSGSRSFARVAFLIEFKTPEDTENFNMAKARDAVIFLLARKSAEELWTGKDKGDLKWEIISRFNDFLGARKVVKIHFTDFIVR